ncbi:MAG TPA: class IV adenylate cyclase [Candidatus Acidoferrales bacterium]|nr:class IV adenylate cyclase [Candidatus Acidoferrales bacterium]
MGSEKKNREIEVKLRVQDVESLLARLNAMGAQRIGRAFEENTLFDTEDRAFRKREAILRLRREQKLGLGGERRQKRRRAGMLRGGILTFKELLEGRKAAKAKYKEREEIEYRVKDVRRFEAVLRRIGMRAWFRYEKYRTKYGAERYPGLSFDLDETPIGAFLELEGPGRQIDRAAKALGYSPDEYITASYLELYAAEHPRRGQKFGTMTFKKQKSR